jgi:hypothetical protein
MRSDGSDLMSRTNHPAFNAAPDWQPLDDDEENDGDDDRASDGRESGPVAMRARSPIVYFAVFDAVPVGESAVPVASYAGEAVAAVQAASRYSCTTRASLGGTYRAPAKSL